MRLWAVLAGIVLAARAAAGEVEADYVEEWRAAARLLEKYDFIHVKYQRGHEIEAGLLQLRMVDAGYTRSSEAAIDYVDFLLASSEYPEWDGSHTITFRAVDVLFGPPGAGVLRMDPARLEPPQMPAFHQLPPAGAKVVTVAPRKLAGRVIASTSTRGMWSRDPYFGCGFLPEPGLTEGPIAFKVPVLPRDDTPKVRHLRLVFPRVDLGRPSSASVWVRVRLEVDGHPLEYTTLAFFAEAVAPFEPCPICALPDPRSSTSEECVALTRVAPPPDSKPPEDGVLTPPTQNPSEAPDGGP